MRPPSLISLMSLLVAAPIGLMLPEPFPLPSGLVMAQSMQMRETETTQGLQAADRLFEQGTKQQAQNQNEAAIKSYQQALKFYRAIGARNSEYATLKSIAEIYNYRLREYSKALDLYQQALVLAKAIGDRLQEANLLESMAWIYYRIKQRTPALEHFQKSVVIYRHLGNKGLEHEALKSIEMVQNNLFDNHPPNFGLAEQAHKKAEANHLVKQGKDQGDSGQLDAALQSYQQALKIYQEIQEHQDELSLLAEIRRVYWKQNNISKTIEYAQKELALSQKLNDTRTESLILLLLNEYYRTEAEYGKAVKVANELLELARKNPGNALGVATALSLLRETYQAIGDKDAVENYQNLLRAEQERINISDKIIIYQKNLIRAREQHNLKAELNTLRDLGELYTSVSDYIKAIDYYEQGLKIAKETKDGKTAASILERLGTICHFGWQNQAKAAEYYQQLLSQYSRTLDKSSRLVTIYHLGDAYKLLKNYTKAVEYYEQYSTLDPESWYDVAKNLLESYIALGHYSKAINYAQQKLKIVRQNPNYQRGKSPGDHQEKLLLPGLGIAYQKEEKYSEAQATFQDLLAISQEKRGYNNRIAALIGLASVFSQQNKLELAIALYKQAIGIIQIIRQDLQQLPKQTQEAYIQQVENTYRALADLLLAQGRISEAQQVLELLKVQELKNFTRNAEVGDGSRQVIILKPEQEILQRYGTVVAFGQKLNECERTGKVCKDLRDELDRLTAAFNQDSNVFTKELRERLAKDPAFLTADQLSGTATDIVTAEPGTVLVYPLVLPNKLRILLAVKAGQGVAFRSFEVSVGQRQLWETVAKFREQISTPHLDRATLNATSQQLYDWLIRPLEAELQSSHIHHLVFALDRSTRYIPMAALYDKQTKQYLIEKYAISTILSAELTDIRDHRPLDPNQISVLALGASDVQGFNPLPNVPAELAAIVGDEQHQIKGIFQGQKFLNQTFDYDALRDHLAHRQIVHIASHAAFEKNAPEQSFILLGTGERLTIESIQQLQNYMRQVDLVVLSACQTAVGGPDESGIEVPGISFYFLRNKVKSVMASLWEVSDSSTSLLMQQFYQNLATGKMTKAEALRQAQLSLLQAKLTAADASQRSPYLVPKLPPGTRQLPTNHPTDFSHPYYWAPFILIGDGL